MKWRPDLVSVRSRPGYAAHFLSFPHSSVETRYMNKPLRRVLHQTKNNRFVATLRNFARRWKWRNAAHDEVYDQGYFDFVEGTTRQSASIIAQTLIARYSPKSVMDVGCGTGVLLEQFQSHHVLVQGVEYAKAALDYCRQRGLDVESVDLRQADQLPTPAIPFDLVVSMEVAHQMPASCAKSYVAYLCRLGRTVVFSSESPSYVDRRSLNSQYPKYWIELFSQEKFRFDQKATTCLQNSWKEANVAAWFCRNVLIFERDD